ncbi:HslU--HslV peptidase proteolytic subunit [bacterium]|nr:MAG: HslU--HslV peptidase proteolytic subunit [bacterium]
MRNTLLKSHSTTIIGLRLNGKAAIGGDGQVSLDDMIFKASAKKVRRLDEYDVLVGFAGAAADGLTLLQRFEEKLSEYSGNIPRAVVELAKDWRTDRYLRRLEAMIVVISKQHSFILSGTGDVIEPDDGICAIGSGGGFALASARAMLECKNAPEDPAEIIRKSLEIAADICIYTNKEIEVLSL